MKTTLLSKKGFSLLEVVLATLILGVVVGALIHIQSFMSKHSVQIKDKTFANQKAIQMMEELRALVSGSEKSDVTVLDDFDDGSSFSAVLTTDKAVTDPSSPISGNRPDCNSWHYLRQISVIKLSEEPFARKVFVRVYKNDCKSPGKPSETLAETMSILKTIKSEYVPSQVLDVYIIAIENIPGWWSSLPLMRPIFEAILQDMETRNPGLEVRPHWITRSAFGRDPYYTPYMNMTTYTQSTAIPYVYFYPGLTKDDNSQDYYYYDSDLISGKINIDGTLKNTTSYSLADQFNHAVRYPEEETLYAELKADALSKSQPEPEVSLRMLLEGMISNPSKYKNILLLNLHGELLPVPPMRNYSDPAKYPQSYPDYRVVTHPEQIHYNTTDTAIKLRVYPYMMSPTSYSNTLSLSTMTVYFPDLNIDASNFTITQVAGNASTTNYTKTTLASSSPYYAITHPNSTDTLLSLYSTPMRHGATSGKQGATAKMYELEYMPAPPFTDDLIMYSTGSTPTTKLKNSARWIISIPVSALPKDVLNNPIPRLITFQTRIGDDMTTGSSSNHPENVSKSYIWFGISTPATEQFQYIGDPRYCPYSDVKNYSGYNWYYTNVPSSATVTGFTYATPGWGDDKLDVDIPRIFQTYRSALLNSNAIWSAMNGYSYYYFGLGGEFGSDQSPLASSIKFVKKPWSTSGETSTVYVNEILSNYGKRLISKTDNSWYGRNWLGELYPDSQYAIWQSSGNLPTGSGNFYRSTYKAVSSYFDRERTSRAAGLGCTSFFNGVSSGSNKFNHTSVTTNGTLTTLGTNVSSMFNQPFLTSVSAPRPFKLTESSNAPPEWSNTIYSSQRTTLSIPIVGSTDRTFYTSATSGYTASAAVRVSSGTNTCHVVVSGLATQADFGTAQMGKYVLLSMLRTFFDGGMYSGQDYITPLPYVQISSPTISDTFSNPSLVYTSWDVTWKRWDGEQYTEEYPPATFTAPSVAYNLKYSSDNGRTWKFCSTPQTTATAGVKDSDHLLTTTSYNWDVSSLGRGSYIIRIEAFRGDVSPHYSYDQVQIYINK